MITALEPNTESFFDTGLLASTGYEYWIESFNQYGAAESRMVAQSTLVWESSIESFSPQEGEVLIESAPIFEWSAVADAESYEIELGNSSDLASITHSAKSVEQSSYRMSEMLEDDRTYYWRVRGLNSDGIPGVWSAIGSFKVQLNLSISFSRADAKATTDVEITHFLQGQPIYAEVVTQARSSQSLRFSWLLNGEPLREESDTIIVNDHLEPGLYTLSCIVASAGGIVAGSARFSVLSQLAVTDLVPNDNEVLQYRTRKMISWTPVSTAVGYHVQIVDVSDGYRDVISDEDNLEVARYELPSSIDASKRYAYRLRAKDANGIWSVWTPEIHFTIRLLQEPEILFPTPNTSFFDRKPTISWKPIPGVRGYGVRLARVDARGIARSQTIDASEFVPDYELSEGRWNVGVRTITAAGEFSDWVTREFDVTAIPVPKPVSPFGGEISSARRPFFQWEEIDEISRYELDYHTTIDVDSASESEQSIYNIPGLELIPYQSAISDSEKPILVSGTSHVTTGELTPGFYEWRVRALTDSGTAGAYSVTQRFIVAHRAPIYEDFYVIYRTTERTPTISWYPTPDADSYELQIAKQSDDYDGSISCATNSYTSEEPLSPGLWKWRVRTTTTRNEPSLFTDDATLAILLPTPMLPEFARNVTTSDANPTLAWVYGEEVDFFEVQIVNRDKEDEETSAFRANESSFTPIDRLTPGKYEWRVRAVLSDGEIASDFSESFAVEIIQPLIRLMDVSGGTYNMGSDSGDPDEAPIHVQQIEPFLLGVFEVTQAEFELVTARNPSISGNLSTCPVENVTWIDAIRFCNALSVREGLAPFYELAGSEVSRLEDANGYRLPSEAEWEYAARESTTLATTTYSGSDNLVEVGWYGDNSGGKTHPVGELIANSIELSDMSGNIWEWTDDTYGLYPSNHVEVVTDSSDETVIRGGSWDSIERSVRVTNRSVKKASEKDGRTGFRIARSQ